MDDESEVKCPAETYGADLVSEFMTRLYDSQEACAAGHGCTYDVCLLDGHWPEETGEDEDEPARACCRGSSRPAGGSGWEFLGSD